MVSSLRSLFLVIVLALAGASFANAATANDKAFDWTRWGVTPVLRDQGLTENCWAISSVEALEANWMVRNKQNIVMSPQPIIDGLKTMGPYFVANAVKYLSANGTTTEAAYPYTRSLGTLKVVATPYRVGSWGYIAGTPGKIATTAQLKAALIQHGPVVVSLDSTKAFQNHKGNGVFRATADTNAPGHAVLLMGWDDGSQCWKIKNSWGKTWGNQSYGWVGYDSISIGRDAIWVESAQINANKTIRPSTVKPARTNLVHATPVKMVKTVRPAPARVAPAKVKTTTYTLPRKNPVHFSVPVTRPKVQKNPKHTTRPSTTVRPARTNLVRTTPVKMVKTVRPAPARVAPAKAKTTTYTLPKNKPVRFSVTTTGPVRLRVKTR